MLIESKELKPKWFILISFTVSWTLFFLSLTYAYLAPTVSPLQPFKKYTLSSLYYILGALGPTIATLSLLASIKDKSYRKNFWNRIYNPHIGPKWLVLTVVLLPIALNGIIILFSLIGTGPIFSLTNFVGKNGLFLLLNLIGAIGIFGMLFPLVYHKFKQYSEFHFINKPKKYALRKPKRKKTEKAQEISKIFTEKWKNVKKKTLSFVEHLITKIRIHLKHNSWLYTAIFVGLLWSIWHFPISLIHYRNSPTDIEGSFLNSWGVSSFAFWEYFILILIQTVIVSWLYHKTGNSTFVVWTFFLSELTRYFFTVTVTFQVIRFVIWCLIALFVIFNEYLLHIVKIPES